MSRPTTDRMLDDLYELSDEAFSSKYRMTKRDAHRWAFPDFIPATVPIVDTEAA